MSCLPVIFITLIENSATRTYLKNTSIRVIFEIGSNMIHENNDACDII